MKKILFATALAAAALVSTSALAQVSGYVGLGYANSEIDTPLGDAEGDGYALSAAVFAPISEKVGLQFDGSVVDADDSDVTFNGTVHVVGEVGNARIGGFLSGADIENNSLWAVGGEGQVAVSEQVTLAGSLAFARADDADVDLIGGGAEARFFATDNLRLGASLGYVDVQDVDISAWTYGAEAEYQLDALPLSFVAGVSRADFDDLDVTIDAVSIGVRYNFGAGTLKARDRDGASLPGISGLAGVAGIL